MARDLPGHHPMPDIQSNLLSRLYTQQGGF